MSDFFPEQHSFPLIGRSPENQMACTIWFSVPSLFMFLMTMKALLPNGIGAIACSNGLKCCENALEVNEIPSCEQCVTARELQAASATDKKKAR